MNRVGRLMIVAALATGVLSEARGLGQAIKEHSSQKANERHEVDYTRKEIPPFVVPPYKGKRYQRRVPDTLDLAERAELAINGLTGPTDPTADYELLWIMDISRKPPRLRHDYNDWVQMKFVEALPLMRIITGSDLNSRVDRRWMEVNLHMIGEDGLAYFPVQGRPWARLQGESFLWKGIDPSGFDQYAFLPMVGRQIGALTLFHLRDPKGIWRRTIDTMIARLLELAVEKEDFAYFRDHVVPPGYRLSPTGEVPLGMEASLDGWVIQGLVQYYRATGHVPARELADKLARHLKDHSQFFDSDGTFIGGTHFHHHALPLQSLMELARATQNRKLAEFVNRGYLYARANGIPEVGFFPEDLVPDYPTSETCEVADMIALALELTQSGVGDYWDDVDRYVRNQFVENQMRETEWVGSLARKIEKDSPVGPDETTDRVAERNVGAFAGWPCANDWWCGRGPGIMHCCTGNGARAIYYVWKSILDFSQGRLRVNLLLNRASRWADIDSYIPYAGRVDVWVKQACQLEVRIPEWVAPGETTCRVNGKTRQPTWDARYARVGSVQAGDRVELTFPMRERLVRRRIGGINATLTIKGNTVVAFDPPGKNYPLYQRSHYQKGQVRWKEVTRFVSEEEIDW